MTDDIPAHLVHIETDRGFRHLPNVEARHGHVRIYESSLAFEGPHIWVLIAEQEDLNDPNSPIVERHAHLHIDQAKELRDQIDHLIDNHYMRDEE